MDIVADASVFLAVILNESSRDWVIETTVGLGAVAPEILPYEIANALVVVRRKGRLTDLEVLRAFENTQRIPVRLLPVTIPEAVRLAMRFGIYAYDAFYLQCCIERQLPLISLDARMCDVARQLKIKVREGQ